MYYYYFNSTFEISENERNFTAILLIMINLIGFAANLYICSGFMFGLRYRGGFYVYCTSKTVGNIIYCIICCFWVVPSIFRGNVLLPPIFNYFLSQLLAFGLYIQAISCQFLMAINRLLSILSNNGSRKKKNVGIVALSSLSTWCCLIIWTMLGFPDCSNRFNPSLLIFEERACLVSYSNFKMYTAVVLLIFSNVFDCFSFLLLICGTSRSSNSGVRESSRRRKRSIRMLVQTSIQSIVYLIQIMICSSLFNQSSNVTSSTVIVILLSTSLIIMIDGILMLIFNTDIKPSCIAKRKLSQKTSVISISGFHIK